MNTPQHRSSEDFMGHFELASPAILAWARLRLGGCGVDAGDVLQEVWMRGSREFDRYDPARGSFRAWIFQVAKSTLLDTLRQRTSAQGQGVCGTDGNVAAPGRLEALPERVTNFTRRVARDETLQKLLDELSTLEGHDRELAVICGLEGRPTTDAARLLGLSHETSRKQWQRLRERLARNPRILELLGTH